MTFRPADAEIDPPRDGFHGTKATLKPGDLVLPRGEHGGEPTNAPLVPGGERRPSSDEYVYVTRRYLLAWAYAHMSGASGDPLVLVVDPQGEIEPDPESSDHMYAYRCRSARVRAVDDLVPISAETAEQGWKQPHHDLLTYVVKSPDPD